MSEAAFPRTFRVGEREVGLGEPCLIIGEVAQSHDGSLGQAHAFIDAIATAGADAVKFQTHIAEAESTPSEPWRVRFSKQDESRYEYWRRMEFTEEQWAGLASHAAESGLIFLSSPFSDAAVDLLERIGMPAWKVASGEVGNAALFERMMRSRKPMLISSGMSGYAELDAAVSRVANAGLPCSVMQCTTAYPCPPERIGLNVMSDMGARYGTPVGLSDHSGTIFPSLAAATLGASVVEVHVAFSREMFGPDVPASVTTAELAELVRGVRFIERMMGAAVDKDAEAAQSAPLRALFTKSLVLARDLPAGAEVTRSDIAIKKPGSGMSPDEIDRVVGRRLRHALLKDALLKLDDLD